MFPWHYTSAIYLRPRWSTTCPKPSHCALWHFNLLAILNWLHGHMTRTQCTLLTAWRYGPSTRARYVVRTAIKFHVRHTFYLIFLKFFALCTDYEILSCPLCNSHPSVLTSSLLVPNILLGVFFLFCSYALGFNTNSSVLLVITRREVLWNRRFRPTYRSHLQGS